MKFFWLSDGLRCGTGYFFCSPETFFFGSQRIHMSSLYTIEFKLPATEGNKGRMPLFLSLAAIRFWWESFSVRLILCTAIITLFQIKHGCLNDQPWWVAPFETFVLIYQLREIWQQHGYQVRIQDICKGASKSLPISRSGVMATANIWATKLGIGGGGGAGP